MSKGKAKGTMRAVSPLFIARAELGGFIMSQAKHEMDRLEEQERSQLGKSCERCGNPISYKEYAENDGLCSYCKDGFEKMERE